MSNHEQKGSSFVRYILSEALILRQAQDERRVEGLRTSACTNALDAQETLLRWPRPSLRARPRPATIGPE